ncbi:Dehydrogenase/reductase SDR member 11, partial [Homalodisca vitripennis]
MDKWRGKVAIVTGASAGIGAAVVQALVHHGMVVVGLARRTEKIEEMSAALSKAGEKGKLVGIKTDLKKEGDILSAFQWVEKELGGPDVLVNNAGITYLGNFQACIDCKSVLYADDTTFFNINSYIDELNTLAQSALGRL